jgi:hypothetical protein
VPQWVLDEAAGRTVTPVPFRGATAVQDLRPPARKGGRRTARVATAVAVACGLAAIGLYLRGGPSTTSPERGLDDAAGPHAGLVESSKPLGTPPDVPAMTLGRDYRFLRPQKDGSPVTWSPCRPLRYVVRSQYAPPGGDVMVREAISTIAAATGLRFEDGGPTQEAPSDQREAYQPDRYGKRWAPVLIAWATPDEVPDLAPRAVLGEGSPYRVQTPSGDSTIVSGHVYLDPADIGELVATSGPAAGRAVVLHELGHLVGLAHVNNPAQIMNPEDTGATELGDGDRAGLAAVGAGPCQPDV